MSDQPAEKPPVPTPVTVAIVLIAVGLVVGAFLLGRALAGGGNEEQPTDPSAPLVAPAAIDSFQVSETAAPTAAPDVGKDVVRATYTDGTDRILLILSRPETDLTAFLSAAGIEGAEAREGEASPEATPTVCGRSTDTQLAACGRLVGDTGQLLVAVSDVDSATLGELLDRLPA